MTTFTQVVLFTDTDGRARFREEPIALTEGKPESRLSPLMASGGYQFRHSPHKDQPEAVAEAIEAFLLSRARTA